MKLQEFVEAVASYYQSLGLSPTAGRILGWLFVCDPPEQTMRDLVHALQVAKSSISTETRMLVRFKLIQRIRIAGQRQAAYRISTDTWLQAFRNKIEAIHSMRKLAEKGLELLKDEPNSRKKRLKEMRDIYSFFERKLPQLLKEWEARESK